MLIRWKLVNGGGGCGRALEALVYPSSTLGGDWPSAQEPGGS